MLLLPAKAGRRLIVPRVGRLIVRARPAIHAS